MAPGNFEPESFWSALVMLRPDSPSAYPSVLQSTVLWILGPQIYPRDN